MTNIRYKENFEKIVQALGEIPSPPKLTIENYKDKDLESILKGGEGGEKKAYLKKYEKKVEKKFKGITLKILRNKINLTNQKKLSYNTIFRYIKKMREFGIVNKKYLVLREEYKFLPLRIWYKDLIIGLHPDNIIPFHNLTLFHPGFPSFDIKDKFIWSNEKIETVEKLISKIRFNYLELRNFFDEIGFRKANKIWSEFIQNINVRPLTKLYLYTNIILFHYRTSDLPLKFIKARIISKKIGTDKEKDLLRLTKILKDDRTNDKKLNKWNKAFLKFYEIGSRGSIEDKEIWTSELKELFEQGFYNYIKSNKLQFEKKVFYKDLEKYKYEYNEIKKKSVIERVKMGHFITIIHPIGLSTASLQQFEKINLEKAKEIVKADTSFTLSPNMKIAIDDLTKTLLEEVIGEIRKKPKISEDITPSVDFFKENDFFAGLENEIKSLGMENKKQLYEELHPIALAFDIPALK